MQIQQFKFNFPTEEFLGAVSGLSQVHSEISKFGIICLILLSLYFMYSSVVDLQEIQISLSFFSVCLGKKNDIYGRSFNKYSLLLKLKISIFNLETSCTQKASKVQFN